MRSNILMLTAAVTLGTGGGLLQGFTHTAPPRPIEPGSDTAAVPRVAPIAMHPVLAAARAVLSGVGIERGAGRMAEVQTALAALQPYVHEQSDPNALKTAFKAYFAFRAAHPEQVRKPYLYFVDYGLESYKPRGYVFDMSTLRVVDGPFNVAHGRGSALGQDVVPRYFSNGFGSNATSLGLFLAQEAYSFYGHADGGIYHSIGMRLEGLSGRFNSAARARGVVVHGAPYVTDSKAGRSEGCPAMEPARARELVPEIANGGLVFLFSPNDPQWVDGDPWANATGASAAMNG